MQGLDTRGLREELKAAGVFRHRTAASVAKYMLLMSIGISMWVVALLGPTWLMWIVCPLTAIPLVGGSMIGHEAAHGCFSNARWKNELMLHIAFPLATGLGTSHWKQKHNVLHHGHPNVHGVDDDIDLWPMALCDAAYQASPKWRQWFQRHAQGYFFWPLTSLLSFVMRVETFKSTVRLAKERGITKLWVADVVSQLAHYALFIGVAATQVGLVRAVSVYVITWAVGGVLLALIFAPAHIGLPVTDDQEKGWSHQLETTRNLKLPAAISYLFIGLDYQVEHHLFPKIPHQNLPRAREILKPWCERHGLPHHELPYLEAFKDTTLHFFEAWKVAPYAEQPETEPTQLAA